MKISVACDGSEHSQNAVKMAMSLPFKNPELTLVHVVSPVIYDPEFVSDESQKQIELFNKDLHKQGQKILDDCAKTLEGSQDKVSQSLLTGYPSECLSEVSAQCDLMILGARGVNPVQSLFLGSVADHLVRYAPCPVLVCRNQAPVPENHTIESMVAGIDGSKMSRKVLEFLACFDASKIKNIHLVSALKKNFYFGISYSEEESNLWGSHKKDIETQLSDGSDFLKKKLPESRISTHLLDHVSDISTALTEFCDKQKAEVLVTGSHGKDLMDRILLGSVSWKLAHQSDFPLLIVR